MRASVTIAIPTRNRRALLSAAVDSALAATQPHDQIIVSDNASTDDTPSYLASLADPRVSVLRQATDLGMVGNWNACLAAARGERFVMLSDDDLIESTAVNRLSALLDDEAVAFGYGRSRVIDGGGAEKTIGHRGPGRESGADFLRAWFGFQRTIYPCATIFRTADLRAAGGYRGGYGPYADVGAWLSVWSAAAKRGIAFASEIVASYRTHDAALSSGNLESGIDGVRALRDEFADAIGPFAHEGFNAMAAHYIASALRRRATGTRMPVVEYVGHLVRNLPAVFDNWSFDAYWRQALILADPEAYERAKQRRAEGSDKSS